MVAEIKLKAKELLADNTLRLFFICVSSFLLRWGTILLCGFFMYYFYNSNVLSFYLEQYNNVLVYAFLVFDFTFVFSVLVLFVSAIRLGEQFVYFSKASGARGRFLLLFRFCTFESSFKAAVLYFKLNFLKLMWFCYYLLPSAVCYGITFYLYSNESILPIVFYILIGGGSVLLLFSVFTYRATAFRYGAAVYYMCLNEKTTPSRAIAKSIRFTDGLLKTSAVLEASFSGWLLSCVAVIPVIYVLPYLKLSKAVCVTEHINKKAYSESESEYAISYMLPLLKRGG